MSSEPEVAVGGYVLAIGGPGGTLITGSSKAQDAGELAAALDADKPPRRAPVDVADDVTGRIETAAGLFDKLASGTLLTPGELEAWLDPALNLIERLDREARYTELLELARTAHRVLALVRRWIELVRMLRRALHAAHALGDDSAIAWAQHELGTLHLAAGRLEEADSKLSDALAIRKRLGERDGVAATEQSLRSLCRRLREQLRERDGRGRPRRLVVAALALLMFMTGAVASAVVLPTGTSVAATETLVAAVHGHGSVTGAGIDCPGRCTAQVPLGQRIALTPTAAAGSKFTGWSGDCSGSGPCRVRLDAPRHVTAHFRKVKLTGTLTVATVGAGHVTSRPAGIGCPSICSATEQRGTTVTLHPVPVGTAAFAGWSGGGCSGTGDCVVAVRKHTSVTARFVTPSVTATLTVVPAGKGAGTVLSVPRGVACGGKCSAVFDAGATVTLRAAARDGSVFTGWSGAGCTGTRPCTVTLTGARTVTATFAPLPPRRFALTSGSEGTGTGSVTPDPPCDGTPCAYDAGTVVTVTADGAEFTDWSACPQPHGTTCTVTMDADQTVTAVFTKPPDSTVG